MWQPPRSYQFQMTQIDHDFTDGNVVMDGASTVYWRYQCTVVWQPPQSYEKQLTRIPHNFADGSDLMTVDLTFFGR